MRAGKCSFLEQTLLPICSQREQCALRTQQPLRQACLFLCLAVWSGSSNIPGLVLAKPCLPQGHAQQFTDRQETGEI